MCYRICFDFSARQQDDQKKHMFTRSAKTRTPMHEETMTANWQLLWVGIYDAAHARLQVYASHPIATLQEIPFRRSEMFENKLMIMCFSYNM